MIGMLCDPAPGYSHYFENTKRWGDYHGGIIIVAPNGRYLHVPFQICQEVFRQAEGKDLADAVELVLRSGCREMVKHLPRLKRK